MKSCFSRSAFVLALLLGTYHESPGRGFGGYRGGGGFGGYRGGGYGGFRSSGYGSSGGYRSGGYGFSGSRSGEAGWGSPGGHATSSDRPAYSGPHGGSYA